MREFDAYRLAEAIKEAGTTIGGGFVVAGVLVSIALFRLAKALREQGQRLP